jgi:hypothetical protein
LTDILIPVSLALCGFEGPLRAISHNFPVAIARGKHLFPFRTEPLSPSAPMVLGPQGPGRVGRRRFFFGSTDPALALRAGGVFCVRWCSATCAAGRPRHSGFAVALVGAVAHARVPRTARRTLCRRPCDSTGRCALTASPARVSAGGLRAPAAGCHRGRRLALGERGLCGVALARPCRRVLWDSCGWPGAAALMAGQRGSQRCAVDSEEGLAAEGWRVTAVCPQ